MRHLFALVLIGSAVGCGESSAAGAARAESGRAVCVGTALRIVADSQVARFTGEAASAAQTRDQRVAKVRVASKDVISDPLALSAYIRLGQQTRHVLGDPAENQAKAREALIAAAKLADEAEADLASAKLRLKSSELLKRYASVREGALVYRDSALRARSVADSVHLAALASAREAEASSFAAARGIEVKLRYDSLFGAAYERPCTPATAGARS